MIKAHHKDWARIIFKIYIHRILKKNFSHFFIVNEVPSLPEDKAVLVAPNHMSWWDGFFVDYLNRHFFKRNAYAMMLEQELKKHKILSKIGAYSINTGNIRSVHESMDYTKELLFNKNNLVVFFPEGVLYPFDVKPNNLKKGIVKLSLNVSKSFTILPLAFKISYYNEKLPEIYAYFGPLIDSKDLAGNHTIFKNIFAENLNFVHYASIKRSYIKDLFK